MTKKARRAKTKRIIKTTTENGSYWKRSDGRWGIDGEYANGKRYRVTRDSEELARDTLIQNGKKTFDAGTAIFSDALDLLSLENQRKNRSGAHQRTQGYIIGKREEKNPDGTKKKATGLHLAFGSCRLTEFYTEEMVFVQRWFDEEHASGRRKDTTLKPIRTAIKKAFALAKKAKMLIGPNPYYEFGISITGSETEERLPLTLNQLDRFAKAAVTRGHREHLLSWLTRCLIFFIGTFQGTRPGEGCGLTCENTKLDTRRIYVRNSVRKALSSGYELKLEHTKTRKRGFRTVPMSPIVHAALEVHFREMQRLGIETTGNQLLYIVNRTDLVDPLAIANDHWPKLCAKAGVTLRKHVGAYILRHTFANLLAASGMELYKIARLMGDEESTVAKHYEHPSPEYVEVIRPQVEAYMERYRISKTDEGYIHAVGVVMARRWIDLGIEIGCSPQPEPVKTVWDVIPDNGPPLLEGSFLELKANTESSQKLLPTSFTESSEGWLTPAENLERRRLAAIKMFRARIPELVIQTKLHISAPTLNQWVRTAGIDNVQHGKMPRQLNEELNRSFLKLRSEHPRMSSTEMAKILGIFPSRVLKIAARLGQPPFKCQPGRRVVGKYANEIDTLAAAGLGHRRIATELKRLHPDEKTPTPSGIADYRQKSSKVAALPSGTSIRSDVAKHDVEIRKLAADGKGLMEIRRKLSHSGVSFDHRTINKHIKKMGYVLATGKGKYFATRNYKKAA